MMSDWNSELYLKFNKERTQPAIDLANRVRTFHPRSIADLGCGPGNSTAVLKEVFPGADILGIDSSEKMIKKARAEHPDIKFSLCDVHALEGGYDMLFSNACLQWIPNHESLLPELMGKLNAGGALAVQVPMNHHEPLYKIIEEVSADPKWGLGNTCFETNAALEPDEYYDVLAGCSMNFQTWETIYCHDLPSHQALVDWVKGTRLRPYLDALTPENAILFEKELVRRAAKTYKVHKNGRVLLHFKRFFFVAIK